MTSIKALARYGGLPCLDFANTLDWRGREFPEEYLNRYADLLEWARLAGILTQKQSKRLAAGTKAAAAQSALVRAVAFREAAYRVLLASVRGLAPQRADVQAVNRVVGKARSRTTLRYHLGRFSCELSEDERDPNLPLWTIALSLTDLLTSENLVDVQECGGPECGWLFLDRTKNRARRWCSMEGCGNRAKARRHYARTH